MLLLAACSTGVPTELPTIVINITAVQDQAAVDNAVNATLTSIAAANNAATLTAMARAGTPVTSTPTPTITPSVTPTIPPRVTPTPTVTPSITPTPTFEPVSTSTPAPPLNQSAGMVRVINVYRDLTPGAPLSIAYDVYLNDQRAIRALDFGQPSNYFQVAPGSVRVSLYPVDAGQNNPASRGDALATLLVPVGAGNIITAFVIKGDNGPAINILQENPAAVAPNMSRVTVLNYNPLLLPVNILLPDVKRAVAYNFRNGQTVGPFELPIGAYTPELYDAARPEQFIEAFSNPIQMDNQASYMVVLLPPLTQDKQTDYYVFSGKTLRLDTDFAVRFINLASDIGKVNVLVGNQPLINNFEPNVLSAVFSLPVLGSTVVVSNADWGELGKASVGPPWKTSTEGKADKIILLYDAGKTGTKPVVGIKVISQDAPPSALNANIRLIHALPGVVQLNLQMRLSTRTVLPTPTVGPNTPIPTFDRGETPWLPGPIASFGEGSFYTAKPAQTYDIRIVLAGANTVYAEVDNVQLLANGTYDVLALPGAQPGSARIVILQPDQQPARIEATLVESTAVSEAVRATLTAQAPKATATPTRAITPTATPTPPPTNTPRPSNTPEFPPPSIAVDPAPPDTASGDVTVSGLYFSPNQSYTVSLDNDRVSGTGKTDENGALNTTITLPQNAAPGPHILSVCVDCRPGGANQVAYTPLLVAPPNLTPSPSPSR
jgi:hypothetical protein